MKKISILILIALVLFLAAKVYSYQERIRRLDIYELAAACGKINEIVDWINGVELRAQ